MKEPREKGLRRNRRSYSHVYSVGSHRLARSTKGKSPSPLPLPPPSPPPPLSFPLSVLRGVRGTEGAPAGRPAGRFGRGKVNAPWRTVSRCEAEQCRRRRRRYHRRRHLEQIMARIRRGGERTAGRTGFSWVGLGWVGITSAIDLITPCGPRCLLVSVPLSLSISPLALALLAFPHLHPSPPPTLVSLPCPSSPSHSFSFSLAPSSLPRVPSPRVTSRFFSRRFLHLCLCRLFARFLSPFRSYFLAPASSSPAVCSALPPLPSLPSPPPAHPPARPPLRYVATLHCTPERFLFLFLQPRADPPLALPIYQARCIRVALQPRARVC